MLRILFILLLALVVYALVDCVRNDEVENPVALPKALWVVLIIVFPGAGALAWLLVSRASRQTQRAAGSGAGAPRPPFGPSRPTPRRPVMRQVAPDDDPEFLASLNRQQQEEQRQREASSEEQQSDDDAEGPQGGSNTSSDEDGGPAPRR